MSRRTSFLLPALLAWFAACVINTRPHLPDEENDAGRVNVGFDAATAGGGADSGAPMNPAADASTPADAPPPAEDAAGGGTEFNDSCFAANAPRDGGAFAGDVPDGGDAGFVDNAGNPCDPRRPRDAGADARDGDDAPTTPDARSAR